MDGAARAKERNGRTGTDAYVSGRRAVTPVVAVVLLVGVTVAGASIVAVGVLATDLPSPSDPLALSLTVDADENRVTLTHRGGSVLNVTRLEVTVAVDGRPLDKQPPVPFFAAAGFRGGPTGPFNSGADPRWGAGQNAGFRVAATNDPPIRAGATVSVTVRRDRRLLTRIEAMAEEQ